MKEDTCSSGEAEPSCPGQVAEIYFFGVGRRSTDGTLKIEENTENIEQPTLELRHPGTG